MNRGIVSGSRCCASGNKSRTPLLPGGPTWSHDQIRLEGRDLSRFGEIKEMM